MSEKVSDDEMSLRLQSAEKKHRYDLLQSEGLHSQEMGKIKSDVEAKILINADLTKFTAKLRKTVQEHEAML